MKNFVAIDFLSHFNNCLNDDDDDYENDNDNWFQNCLIKAVITIVLAS